MQADLADRIADWALQFQPADAARRAVSTSIRDFAACARAGLRRPEMKAYRMFASKGDVPFWLDEATAAGEKFTWQRADGAGAALLQGVAGSLLQLHDVHADLGMHASCAVIPAAWAALHDPAAVVEDRAGFENAVAAGYETAYNVAKACAPRQAAAGGSATGTAGALGAAVASARLLGVDRIGIARALGHASLMLAATPSMPMRSHAAAAPLHGGIAARCGYEAALLAREVGTGRRILEGDATGPGLIGLLCGDPRLIVPEEWQGASFKSLRWKLAPGCVAALPAVEAARELRARCVASGKRRGPMESVELRMQSPLFSLIAAGPFGDDLYDRMMSVRWLVARALISDAAVFDVPDGPDQAAAALASRIELAVGEDLDVLLPDTAAADLLVRWAGDVERIRLRRSVRSTDHASRWATTTLRADDPALLEKWRQLEGRIGEREEGWHRLCELAPVGIEA